MRHSQVIARLRAGRSLVCWVAARRAFVHVPTNRALSGITARLRRRFWPAFRRRSAVSAAPSTSAPRLRGAGRGGMARGRRVDREVRAPNSRAIPANS